MEKVFISVGYRYKNETSKDRTSHDKNKNRDGVDYYQNAVPDVILAPQVICPDAFTARQSGAMDTAYNSWRPGDLDHAYNSGRPGDLDHAYNSGRPGDLDHARNRGLGRLEKDTQIQLTEYLSVPGQSYDTAELFLVAFSCEETLVTNTKAVGPEKIVSVTYPGHEETGLPEHDTDWNRLSDIVLVDEYGRETTGAITSFVVLDTASYSQCVEKQFVIWCRESGTAQAVGNSGTAQDGSAHGTSQEGNASGETAYMVNLAVVTKMSPGAFEKIVDDLKNICMDLLRHKESHADGNMNYLDKAGQKLARYQRESVAISKICEELRESPESDVICEERRMPFDKVKQLDSRTILDHYILGKQKVRTTVHTQSFDTYENRKIKAYIRTLLREMSFFRKNIDLYKEENKENRKETVCCDNMEHDIEEEIRRLNKILSLNMFRDVAKTDTRLHATNLFTNHPKYARAYKLMKGSDEIQEILDLAPQYEKVNRNVELYEFWCFYKVVSILTDDLGFEITGIRKPRKAEEAEQWTEAGKDGRRSAAILLKNALQEWNKSAGGNAKVFYGTKIELKKEDIILQIGYNYSLSDNATNENGEHFRLSETLEENDCSKICGQKKCLLLYSVNKANDVRPDIYINVWKDDRKDRRVGMYLPEDPMHVNNGSGMPEQDRKVQGSGMSEQERKVQGSGMPEQEQKGQSSGMIGRVDDRHHIIILDAKYQDYCNAGGEKQWQTEILNCAFYKHVYRAGAEYSFLLHPGIRNEEEIKKDHKLGMKLQHYDAQVNIKRILSSYEENNCTTKRSELDDGTGISHRLDQLKNIKEKISSEGQRYSIQSFSLTPGKTEMAWKVAFRMNEILEFELWE